MERLCVFLTPLQLQKLAKLVKGSGMKQAEVIRRALDIGIAEMEKK
jgi:DNA replication protein DnaD